MHGRGQLTWAVQRGVGAAGGVLRPHQAERGGLGVVAAGRQLHLAAQVLVEPGFPALHMCAMGFKGPPSRNASTG